MAQKDYPRSREDRGATNPLGDFSSISLHHLSALALPEDTDAKAHILLHWHFFPSLLFVWLTLRGGGILLSSASFSQSGLVRLLKTVWRQARAAQWGWDAIGRLALLPRAWLAAGSHVGFNQLCGSVCRSVCSDVSILFPSSTEFSFFFFLLGKLAVVLIGFAPNFFWKSRISWGK